MMEDSDTPVFDSVVRDMLNGAVPAATDERWWDEPDAARKNPQAYVAATMPIRRKGPSGKKLNATQRRRAASERRVLERAEQARNDTKRRGLGLQ